ncbi:MAG: Ig-like domain-containing protein [Ferruginibacter sp.]
MKILHTLVILLIATTSFGQKELSHQAPFAGNAATGLNAATEDWLHKAQKIIKEREYYFKPAERPGSFYAANMAQRLGFIITGSDYKTSPVKFSENTQSSTTWQQRLSLSGIGKDKIKMPAFDTYSIVQDRSMLRFDYADFSVEYLNTEKGLRQNFIIINKPAGNDNLRVLLKIDGDLTASVVNNALQFKDQTGALKLFYTDLNVWDANHRIVKATMQLLDNKTLAIIVEDRNAIYPITVDPINKTPEWTTSADGILPNLIGQLAVDAAYGFSVAGLGDVNADGYDDVAIGSPTVADVISGTGTIASVGAVFVYFGSATGLSTTPAAALQPTTPVAGALFGYSIAGGDINNDGKNDVIVGAPLDVITIAIGGGGTASGTVGKVYVYNGANLNTGSSPLLTLQLSGTNIIRNGINLSMKALFGFSVAVTEDLNNDQKKDIIVGAPTYAGIRTLFGFPILDVQSGGAFIFMSTGAAHSLVKLQPIQTGILGLPILQSNINGLLFGYSVDGLGDYNGDGRADVVATAPAGVDLSSISAILNGKLLQGSATVYYGTATGINTSPGATLVATSGGLLSNIIGSISNIANMFGVSVRGLKNSAGTRNGNVLVGAPLGGALMNVLNLQLKTGTVSLFKRKASSPTGFIIPNQVLSSPRNSNNILAIIQSNLLFGYSLDNVYDINCDGFSDIIIGEPASSGAQLINANVAGGAAYVYLGKADSTYQTTPFWTLTATTDAFLGINATSLIGYSVAGAGHVRGAGLSNKILVGTPSRTLDFGTGLLNLGNTLGTIFSLTSGNNGVGKAYVFDLLSPCIGTQATNPDFNSTFINVTVPGNVSTNDKVPAGSTYGTPILSSSPPGSIATITMNGNGTYTFVADKAGVYIYDVPVCVPGQPTPCPTTKLTITVLDATINTNAPVANVDIATTQLNTAVTLKSLTNDAAGNSSTALVPSTVTVTSAPLHGTTTVNPITGDITYTPIAGFSGNDTLTYQVCDNQSPAKCASAKQIITTLPASAANTTSAADDYKISRVNTPATGNVKTNDVDPEGNTQTVTAQNTNLPGKGTLVLAADGSYTFTPDTGFTGPADFPYTTCDNGTPEACASATLHILVSPAGSLPDLTPSIFNDGTTLVRNSIRDNVIRIFNIGGGSTTGTIIFTIPKMLPAFEITIDPNATSMNVFGGLAVTNGDWTIVEQATRFVFTSKPGIVIPVGGFNAIGLKVKAIGIVNSTGNLAIQIILGTGGGETPYNNNNDNNTYSIN